MVEQVKKAKQERILIELEKIRKEKLHDSTN